MRQFLFKAGCFLGSLRGLAAVVFGETLLRHGGCPWPLRDGSRHVDGSWPQSAGSFGASQSGIAV